MSCRGSYPPSNQAKASSTASATSASFNIVPRGIAKDCVPPFTCAARSASIARAAMSIDEPALSSGEIAALARRIDRPIVLVGMMGVGKSTIGRKLAQLLNMPFHDADDEIEEAAQLSITEIFDKFGEAYFRDGERRVMARLVQEGRGVIATGGGAFCQEETRQLILEHAISIWLDSDVDTLVDRVGRKDTRPLLRGGDPREIIARLRAERAPHYSQAHIHITSGAGPHQQTVLKILEALDKWL